MKPVKFIRYCAGILLGVYVAILSLLPLHFMIGGHSLHHTSTHQSLKETHYHETLEQCPLCEFVFFSSVDIATHPTQLITRLEEECLYSDLVDAPHATTTYLYLLRGPPAL